MAFVPFKKISQWLPPAFAAVALIAALLAVVVSLSTIRRIIDDAGAGPIDAAIRGVFPTLDTENLKRLEPRLPAPVINEMNGDGRR